MYDDTYLELCSQGLTNVQIAVRLSLQCADLLSSLSPGVASRGRELCQVYHETLMNSMINGDVKASTKEMDLQQWRLKVMFKEDWADSKEEKDNGPFASLSDDELKFYISEALEKHKETLVSA